MIVYGRGCAGCQTIPRTEQPLVDPKELPPFLGHGNWAAHRLYGCRCAECAAYGKKYGRRRSHG